MTVYSQPIPGLVCIDHTLAVPLDHADVAGGSLDLYAREVRAVERADDDLPYLLFLQGGPGGRSPRPLARDGWLAEALKSYRVLLMDQRGTGRSTPVTTATPAAFADAAALAQYLTHFRADSIIADAELLRARIGGGRPWTTLGQSYGGFLTFTYLSLAPQALAKCLVTGGIPGVRSTAEDVYRRTWPRVVDKNAEFFRRFPADAAVLNRLRDVIVQRGADDPLRLPGGDPLTVARLQALGILFGMSYGFAEVHYLLEEAFVGEAVSPTFLMELENVTEHADAPLYAVLQEVIYSSGPATGWAAERVRADFPALRPDADQLLLTGEMMESTIFREEAAMAPFAEAMEILNAKDDWPALYDVEVLARSKVPVAAAVYFDDMYVDAALSLETAAATPGVRVWVTNEYEHDGLRSDERVFERLHDLATGRA
jgi:pimeloyl-ACP methyl ester carboxylesterase